MAKQSTTKTKKKPVKAEKFEPTKMSLAIAAAAATTLTLFAVIAIYY